MVMDWRQRRELDRWLTTQPESEEEGLETLGLLFVCADCGNEQPGPDSGFEECVECGSITLLLAEETPDEAPPSPFEDYSDYEY